MTVASTLKILGSHLLTSLPETATTSPVASFALSAVAGDRTTASDGRNKTLSKAPVTAIHSVDDP